MNIEILNEELKSMAYDDYYFMDRCQTTEEFMKKLKQNNHIPNMLFDIYKKYCDEAREKSHK